MDYIIFQIHQLFNEFKKSKVTYKCDWMKYIVDTYFNKLNILLFL